MLGLRRNGGIKMTIDTIQLTHIVHIAFEAGQKILNVYSKENFGIEYKEDASPVTLADEQSHTHIIAKLSEHYSHIPILSEEGDLPSYEERKNWRLAWVVDPLDGTKEFIKRNGEFTVNIALIEHGTPILGVIYSPAQDIIYFANSGVGSYKLENCQVTLSSIQLDDDLLNASQKLPLYKTTTTTVAVSRSHFSSETASFIEQLKSRPDDYIPVIEAGSSIKMCLVAEGTASIYPRLSYSMEWDTAAGEAIVKYSGGQVLEYPTNEPLRYNKENLKNPFHIVKR